MVRTKYVKNFRLAHFERLSCQFVVVPFVPRCSIEYWFRCMDLDGDGLLSMYELEYFYSEQVSRMEDMSIEPISFEDCLCQCLDMVKPELGDKIRLSDLKRCRLCHIFFDTFFNLPKYLQHEQRDPFSNLRVSH